MDTLLSRKLFFNLKLLALVCRFIYGTRPTGCDQEPVHVVGWRITLRDIACKTRWHARRILRRWCMTLLRALVSNVMSMYGIDQFDDWEP